MYFVNLLFIRADQTTPLNAYENIIFLGNSCFIFNTLTAQILFFHFLSKNILPPSKLTLSCGQINKQDVQ